MCAVIHSILLWVYFLRGAAEAGNKTDKDGGMWGEGLEGIVVGESAAVNEKR